MTNCFLCQTGKISQLLDCGPQPVCNRYLTGAQEEEFRHPLVVGQCENCGLIQIPNPVPAAELKPRVDWITYGEPEGHLDHLADVLAGLPGITQASTFCGVSFKDDSLLRRMRERGFAKTWRIDLREDAGVEDSKAGIETLQDRLDDQMAAGLVRRRSQADVVVARHILEHAHEPRRFMKGLQKLLHPAGYLVIEVPDCSRALGQADYSTLWEEHVLYFSPRTFRSAFSFCGFSLDRFEHFPYPLEDSLVGIAKLAEQKTASSSSDTSTLADEKRFAVIFGVGFGRERDKFKRILSGYREKQAATAFLGAGHLGCLFINVMGLKNDIDFVVDDDPKKRGLLMPGSRLPIYGSNALLEKNVKLCLVGVNPANQEKLIQKHQLFLERGGVFLSIFPQGGSSVVPAPLSLREDKVACP